MPARWRIAIVCTMFVAANAYATDPNGQVFRHLPIQWCVLDGSPTQVSPGTVDPDNPGADTNTVLWRRHERVTDRIYYRVTASDAANQVVPVSFRSAADQPTFLTVRNFPHFAGPNANGDVDITNTQAVMNLVQTCQQMWGSSAPGLPVINVNHLFKGSTQIGGQGYYSFKCGVDLTKPSSWTMSNNFVLIADRKYNANGDQDANLLGHELGHALNMLHTDPADNIMSKIFISNLDPPHTFSTSITDGVDASLTEMNKGCGSMPDTGIPRTNLNQVDWHQQQAKGWPGTVLDPPGTLISALFPSFILLDPMEDVPVTEGFVDLSAVRVSHDVPAGIVHVTFRLIDQIPETFTPIDYFFLADLDDDAATGGSSAQFPGDAALPPTSFAGVEMIVRVRAQVERAEEFTFFTVTPTVWLFQAGAFQKQAFDFADASIQKNLEADDHPAPQTFEHLEVEFPLSVPSEHIRVQAITHDAATDTVDKLDDTDAGVGGSLAPPRFAACGVTPAPVQPGATTAIDANGLEANAMVKVVLGDLMVASGQTDANGNVHVPFTVPADTRLGFRLMTVGVVGTILTADCALEVVGGPVVCGDGIVGPGEQCDDGNTVSGDCCSATCQLEHEGRSVDQTCSNGKDDDCDGLVDNDDPECNRPPDCSMAVAFPAELWPPNRRFASVGIIGVTDPDGDQVTLTVTGITQDEPLTGRQGAGRRCPDGTGVGTGFASVRAERIGRRDGRVYHVGFRAEDQFGGQCDGLIGICVPHDRRPGHACVDEGPLFDSTGPCP